MAAFQSDLRKGIDKSFSLADLRTICFDLDVNYDNLAGEEKGKKIIELINYLKNRGQLNLLLEKVKAERPHYPWPQLTDSQSSSHTDIFEPGISWHERLKGVLVGGGIGIILGIKRILEYHQPYHTGWITIFTVFAWAGAGAISWKDSKRKLMAGGGALVGGIFVVLYYLVRYKNIDFPIFFELIFMGGPWALAGAICGMDRKMLTAATVGIMIGLIFSVIISLTSPGNIGIVLPGIMGILGAIFGMIIIKGEDSA